MKLIYIHFAGQTYNKVKIYQFLFTSSDADITGEGWDSNPSNGIPQAPTQNVDEVYNLETQLDFSLIQNDVSFDMGDAMEGIIPLSWEITAHYNKSEYPDTRLYFKYGDKLEKVIDKMYERDIELKKINYDK